MKIIIDAMSGDNAPEAIVRGALDAHREFGVELVLTGDETVIQQHLGDASDGVRIVHTREVITMHDDANAVIRGKKDSSMSAALRLLANDSGDAVVSAGNTGALLTGATLIVKRVRGIRRAALAPVLPNGGTGFVLIDCGANSECTEEYLLQFAYMGSFYAKRVLGLGNPRIALLNNGTEETKGTALHKHTYALLTEAAQEGRINFVGNIEGSGAFEGKADVIVTDGFTGNIMLKTVEGTASSIMGELKHALTSGLQAKLGALLVKNKLKSMKAKLDPSEIGGTAMLGISRPVIKAHGSSDARAIRSAVKQAIAVVDSGIIGDIENNIDIMRLGLGEKG